MRYRPRYYIDGKASARYILGVPTFADCDELRERAERVGCLVSRPCTA